MNTIISVHMHISDMDDDLRIVGTGLHNQMTPVFQNIKFWTHPFLGKYSSNELIAEILHGAVLEPYTA